jgi:hypothetical protein
MTSENDVALMPWLLMSEAALRTMLARLSLLTRHLRPVDYDGQHSAC